MLSNEIYLKINLPGERGIISILLKKFHGPNWSQLFVPMQYIFQMPVEYKMDKFKFWNYLRKIYHNIFR